jgi:hypothetical protein
MSNDDRRTLDELAARYTLEPDLDDIFVEGLFDKEIYESCHTFNSPSSKTFYEIDSVHIPYAILETHSLTEGKKQRLVALSREMADKVNRSCAFRCIVDRDLDHWIGNLEHSPFLVWSRYCDIEMFFFDTDHIKTLLLELARAKVDNFDVFFTSLSNALSKIYALRLADRSLGLKLKWFDYNRYLRKENDEIQFEAPSYISMILQKNGLQKERLKFESMFNQWQTLLQGDCRLRSRGHDLVSLLSWTIEKFSPLKDLATNVTIERIMIMMAKGHEEIADEINSA